MIWGWQICLCLLCVAVATVCALIVGISCWHDETFRRIPRDKLNQHRVTPQIPLIHKDYK